MKTIKIRQYTPPQLEVFDNVGNLIGYINHFIEIQRLMSDIKKQNVDGYYMMYGNKRINFDSNGMIGVNNVIFIQQLYNVDVLTNLIPR